VRFPFAAPAGREWSAVTLFDAARAGEAQVDEGPAKVKLVVAYDGTEFHGFAAQPGPRTVAGVLLGAITKVLRHDVELSCAGRTDAGVHAWGQVVSFPAQPGLDPWRLQNAVNSMLAPEVVVRSCELVAPSFDARHSAQWRHYRYTIVNRAMPDPFRDRYTWWVPDKLDLRALRLAADPFIGEHDFSSFCRKKENASNVRRVSLSAWNVEDDGVLRYEVRANAFCWQMVRSIVGTLVDVGTGRLKPGDILAIIRAGDRDTAGQVAPPRGLSLWEVGY
jgi:tRNA pseudouridine38-40 synthase